MPAPTLLKPKDDPINAIANILLVRELFTTRLAIEGKLHLYRARIKKLCSEGKAPGLAEKQAKIEYGLMLNIEERQWYADFLRMKKGSVAKEGGLRREHERLDKQRNAGFERALAKIPNATSPNEDLDWVSSHPLMSRHANLPGGATRNIRVKEEDVLTPPHGRAPSRFAANMLANWVNKPSDFMKMMLQEQKKTVSSKESNETASDEVSKSIDDILAAVTGHRPPAEKPAVEEKPPEPTTEGKPVDNSV